MMERGKMKDGEGQDERWRGGQPIEKYGKIKQKE